MDNAFISQLTCLGRVRKPSPLSAYGAGQKVGGETPTRAHSCGWPWQSGAQRRSLNASRDSPAGR